MKKLANLTFKSKTKKSAQQWWKKSKPTLEFIQHKQAEWPLDEFYFIIDPSVNSPFDLQPSPEGNIWRFSTMLRCIQLLVPDCPAVASHISNQGKRLIMCGVLKWKYQLLHETVAPS